MKRNVLKGFVVMAAVLLCAAVWWGAPAAAEGDASRAARAREVFEQRCARCHGRDGRGQTRLGEMLGVPDFTDAGWWRPEVSDARLKTSITEGKGEMPAFGKKLTKPEINALAAYVRKFAPPDR